MTTVFKLDGLHCSSCKELIEEAMAEVAGVTSAVVNPDASVLTVEHDDTFRAEEVIRIVTGLGAGYAIFKL